MDTLPLEDTADCGDSLAQDDTADPLTHCHRKIQRGHTATGRYSMDKLPQEDTADRGDTLPEEDTADRGDTQPQEDTAGKPGRWRIQQGHNIGTGRYFRDM